MLTIRQLRHPTAPVVTDTCDEIDIMVADAIRAERSPQSKRRPWPEWYTPPAYGCVDVPNNLVSTVARAFGITPEEVRGRSHVYRLVDARGIVSRVLRSRGWSFPRIGRFLGGRDHSTIISQLKRLDIRLERGDPLIHDVLAECLALYGKDSA